MNNNKQEINTEQTITSASGTSVWQVIAFISVLGVFLFTRLRGLEDYPIFFFTDEAVQTVLASDFIRDDYRNYEEELLPTFFENNSVYNLSLSVYLQVIPNLLFDRSPAITRGASVLVALLAVFWLGLIGKNIFHIRNWWLGPLLLSITPAWFLHSRTAFETVLMVSFFSGFLYYYLLYRLYNPRYLYLAFLLGAMALYSYMGGQIIVPLTFILILVLDFRYHWSHRATMVKGLLLAILLATPLLRFFAAHPDEILLRMARYQSYMLTQTSIFTKILSFFSNYLSGLNPLYWFFPNRIDLARHQMNGYGHILWVFLPFTILGFWILAKKWWLCGAARPIFAATFAIPLGAAMIGPGITRLLSMVLPLNIACAIGVNHAVTWIGSKTRGQYQNGVFIALFTTMMAFNGYLLYDALERGPFWHTNYGLHGMQYGASQVFGEIKTQLQLSPQTPIDLSPTWANGTDILARYFLGDPLPIQMRSIQGYQDEYLTMDEDLLIIMTPDEYKHAKEEPKFADIQVEKSILYPDGSPGFYFIRMRYSDDAAALFEQEYLARRTFQESYLRLHDQIVTVKHTTLDMGEIFHVFDNNPSTLVRTAQVNPIHIILEYQEEITISSITLRVGGAPTHVAVTLNPQFTPAGPTHNLDLPETANPRPASIVLPYPQAITGLNIQVTNTLDNENTHVHLWGITIE